VTPMPSTPYTIDNMQEDHDVMVTFAPTNIFYFAEGTCRPGFDPYLCIQNPGTAQAEVKITYMLGDGNTSTQTLSVDPNSRATVGVKGHLGEANDAAHDFSAKVECTNGQQIIAERPMYFAYNGVWTGGHDVVGANSPAQTFYFAEGTCRPGFDPYLCIQNPGTAQAEVKITYMLGDGNTSTQTLSVDPNSRATVGVKGHLGEANDAAHDFSAKVECTNGQQIIAERPMYFDYGLGWTGGHDVVGFVP
jgi:carbon monoxide dehydrogenase subunit G